MSDYRIVHSDELYHYGVPGMRWGHRKVDPISSERSRLKSAKEEYKTANKAYSKAHSKARNFDANPLNNAARLNNRTSKIRKSESDKNWNDALTKGKAANEAEKKYKKAKQDYKQAKSDIKADKKAYKKDYKNDVKTLRKTLGVGDVNLYDDKGVLLGQANATVAAHNEIAIRKGKDYADRALKTARNQTYTKIVGSAVALVGASVALEMLDDR